MPPEEARTIRAGGRAVKIETGFFPGLLCGSFTPLIYAGDFIRPPWPWAFVWYKHRMINVKRRPWDLGEMFLLLVAGGIAVLLAFVAVPSLMAIFTDHHRDLTLPDGAPVHLLARLTGQVELARREGDHISLTGWRRDPREGVEAPTVAVYFHQTRIMADSVDPIDHGAAPSPDHKSFRLVFKLPVGFQPSEPFRVFALTADGGAVELFRGAGPVYLVEDAPARNGTGTQP
jgi:hypothetical protein